MQVLSEIYAVPVAVTQDATLVCEVSLSRNGPYRNAGVSVAIPGYDTVPLSTLRAELGEDLAARVSGRIWLQSSRNKIPGKRAIELAIAGALGVVSERDRDFRSKC